MTVTSTISRQDYTGTGLLAEYDFPFRVFQAEDLLVTVRDLEDAETTLILDVDYSVDGVGNSSGSITLTAGELTTGYALTIRRVLEIIQETDIRNQGPYYPELHENELDRRCMIEQQLQDSLNRTLHFPETVDEDAELPVPEALKFLRWNATEDALENAEVASTGEATFPDASGVAIYLNNLDFTVREIVGVSGVGIENGKGLLGNPTVYLENGGVDNIHLASAAVTALKMDLTDSYDFTAGAVDVETQVTGTSGTSVASTEFVQVAVLSGVSRAAYPVPITAWRQVVSGMALPVEIFRDGFPVWRFGAVGSAVGGGVVIQVPANLPAGWGLNVDAKFITPDAGIASNVTVSCDVYGYAPCFYLTDGPTFNSNNVESFGFGAYEDEARMYRLSWFIDTDWSNLAGGVAVIVISRSGVDAQTDDFDLASANWWWGLQDVPEPCYSEEV